MNADPTPACLARVMRDNPRRSKTWALNYIDSLAAGDLICLDCGSENHTSGHEFCSANLTAMRE